MATSNHIPAAEGLDIVVLGAFNPAIFHPEWFLRQKLITEDEAKSAESSVNVVSKDVTEINLCGMKLICMHDRLSLGTVNISKAARMQDLLLQIFATLAHTPISACGINPQAQYRVADIKLWHKIGDTLAPKPLIWQGLLEEPGMQSLAVKSPRKGDFSGETILWVEPAPDQRFHPGILVRANYHYQLPKEALHAESAELLVKFLKGEWELATSLARTLAETLLTKITLDNA